MGFHDAIRGLNRLIGRYKLNYVLETDNKEFFDNVGQKQLMEFIVHDIDDKNFSRYIVRLLKAGIIEDSKYHESNRGTVQGTVAFHRYLPMYICIMF